MNYKFLINTEPVVYSLEDHYFFAPKTSIALSSGKLYGYSELKFNKSSFSQGREFTWEFWIKLKSLPNAECRIMSRDGVNRNIVVNSGGFITYNGRDRVYDSGYFNTPPFSASSSKALEPGVWTHVAVTSKSGNHTIYINGEIAASSKSSYSSNVGTTTHIIGTQSSDPYKVDALIAETRIWSKVRSQSEISSYKNKRLVQGDGLEASIMFDEGIYFVPEDIAIVSNNIAIEKDSPEIE